MAIPYIPIISAVTDMITGPIKRWQELKSEKHLAKIKRIQQGDEHAADLDRLSIAQRGWKDDYLLLISTFPLVMLFADPFLQGANLTVGIEAGFAALDKMPEYYWYVLGLVYIDTFGFRRMLRVGVEQWLNKRFKNG